MFLSIRNLENSLGVSQSRRNAVLLLLAGLLLGRYMPWAHDVTHPHLPTSAYQQQASFSLQNSLYPSPNNAALSAREKCRNVVDHQKRILEDHFWKAFEGVQRVALIGYPNHSNKGDAAIWLAEEMLLTSMGINVEYVCSGMHDYQPEKIRQAASKGGFAIAMTGGGNLGDLYPSEQELKNKVLLDFPDIKTRWFPQSIHFKDKSLEPGSPLNIFLSAVKGVRDMQLVVRDVPSFEFAQTHIGSLGHKVTLTPDIVFSLGNRPELRQRFGAPTQSLLVFKRNDGESTSWDSWAAQDLPSFFSDQLKEMGPAWNASAVSVGDWTDFDLKPEEILGKSSYLKAAWIRFIQGASWLSSGEVILMDRLHGHILSTLMGIPHVVIDNGIGKLSNYHDTWTKDCPLALFVSPSSDNVRKALVKQRQLIVPEW